MSNWVAGCWLACGVIGGIGFAWSNRKIDERPLDRAMTIAWSFLISLLLGPFSLPGIAELKIDFSHAEEDTP